MIGKKLRGAAQRARLDSGRAGGTPAYSPQHRLLLGDGIYRSAAGDGQGAGLAVRASPPIICWGCHRGKGEKGP